MCDPRCRIWEVGHPGDCGRVSPGARSGRCVVLETVDMCPQVQGLGGGSPWRLWTCEHGCRVWGLCGSHCRHTGLDPVRRDPMCALYLRVSGPL